MLTNLKKLFKIDNSDELLINKKKIINIKTTTGNRCEDCFFFDFNEGCEFNNSNKVSWYSPACYNFYRR